MILYAYVYVLCVCIVNHGHGYTTIYEKQNLALNNLKWFIGHKTQRNQNKHASKHSATKLHVLISEHKKTVFLPDSRS